MLAYVYEGNGRLVLKDMPKPSAKKDSVVIKVNACSICGTDFRTYIHGSSKINPNTIIGHEVTGTIVEVGRSVAGFYEGDRVHITPAIGCGYCYPCKSGHPNMCDNLETIGFQYNGGFAEYMEIPAKAFSAGNVNKLSNLIEDVEAAVAEPIACVLNAQEFLNIKKGDYVAVFGAGFIGCMHAELAFNSGADKVIMIEVSQSRAEEALKLVNKIDMINSAASDVFEEVKRITDGRGVDVAITACSVGKAQEDAIKIAAKRARISLFGGIPGDAKCFLDSNEIHYKELSVFGVHASTPEQNRTILNAITNGSLKVKKYITKIYDLENIVEAFEDLKNQKVLKAIVKP
ncbi:MAG: alcohol dehydrogenase catalytic domain-containing protein [Caldicoprobacterales bacterium]